MRTADRYVAQNRRARHDYLIEDTLEAGVVLHGTEVKVLRQGAASIAEAYADERAGNFTSSTPTSPNTSRLGAFQSRSRGGRASCCCIASR